MTNEKKQPSEKLRLFRARRSTTGWGWVRLRQTKTTPAVPDIQAVARIVPSSNQSHRGPSSNVYSRQPRKIAISAMPT